MKKTDIISRMAEGAGITKAQADKAMEGLFEAVKDGLKDGGKVTFVGFGTFSVAERKARAGRNPKTGEVVEVPAKRVPHFKPGKELKAMVEGK
jgi:DNA-binding protein HU-beta